MTEPIHNNDLELERLREEVLQANAQAGLLGRENAVLYEQLIGAKCELASAKATLDQCVFEHGELEKQLADVTQLRLDLSHAEHMQASWRETAERMEVERDQWRSCAEELAKELAWWKQRMSTDDESAALARFNQLKGQK